MAPVWEVSWSMVDTSIGVMASSLALANPQMATMEWNSGTRSSSIHWNMIVMLTHLRYGNKALAAKLRMDSMRDLGPCISPFNSWLILQGLETLALRGQRHCENTQGLAEWLEKHDCVSWVLYPGLKSHRDYELTKRTMPNGAGGVLTFGVAGTIDEVRAVVDNLKLCSHLANVGDAKTLIIHPWVTTHQQLPDEEKIKGGVTPDLIRISVGLEALEDIIHDFDQAFVAAGLKTATKGVDPFSAAMKTISSGFMKDRSTRAPAPGTDGSESAVLQAKRLMATSVWGWLNGYIMGSDRVEKLSDSEWLLIASHLQRVKPFVAFLLKVKLALTVILFAYSRTLLGQCQCVAIRNHLLWI